VSKLLSLLVNKILYAATRQPNFLGSTNVSHWYASHSLNIVQFVQLMPRLVMSGYASHRGRHPRHSLRLHRTPVTLRRYGYSPCDLFLL